MKFVSLTEFGAAAAADLLTRAFADYFVRIPFTAERLQELARVDSVDLAASRVAIGPTGPAGAALVARRGEISRLAGMGFVPEARRQGGGRALVGHLLAEAHARGERTMVLEVIAQNEPAVQLYERCGFEKVRRLVGYSGRGEGDAAAAERLERGELREAGAAVAKLGVSDLPWQLSGETIALLAPPAVAYRCDDAWIVLADPAAAPVMIRALVAGSETPAAALLRATFAKHPGREWRAVAVWPEELAAPFAEVGLERSALSQWQMVRRLP